MLECATGTSVSNDIATRPWQPLGAESDATWNLDSERSGFEKMESGLNATAADYARFGLLLLNGGEWNGRRIVSQEWLRPATDPHRAPARDVSDPWHAKPGEDCALQAEPSVPNDGACPQIVLA